MKCSVTGCQGRIVDGYCDICGMPGTFMPTGQARMGSAPSKIASGRCPQLGCPGQIIDEYCDICGSPAQDSPAANEHVASNVGISVTASTSLGTLAFGSMRATSFGIRSQRRKPITEAGGSIGAGLTRVAPAPAIDPVKAVMKDPVVPPERRVCPKCGTKVGQSAAEIAGRSDGYCPSCGAPYSFAVKLHPGDLVAGQYRVAGALAHGGMGWIYLARDENVSGRWVVLKGLLNTSDSDALAAAIAEQQFLALVGAHPLIVEIYNFVTWKDAGYIVMEYVGGRSLKQLLKQRRIANDGLPSPLPPDQVLAYLIEILPALSYMHRLDLLYCDFKPDNVIQTDDSLKLIDLGGVRHASDDDSAIFGTIGYQAPEVPLQGPSIASDIFTIGRTLLVLCAEVPGYQTVYEHSLPPVAELPAFAENDSLYRLLQRCCAPDPDDRFTSVDELRDQMLGVLREVVAQRGKVAHTAVASAFFHAPTAIGDQATWKNLPELRLDLTDLGLAAALRIPSPEERLRALQKLPAQSEISLATARAAIEAGTLPLAHECIQRVLQADPWEWRALWILGLANLSAGEYSEAQAAFNSVYGQLPGELAPKLALALACEPSEGNLAKKLYLTCASTDANYTAIAAFGIARINARQGDIAATMQALGMVPVTSRGYPQAQRLRAHFVITNSTDPKLEDAFAALNTANFDIVTHAKYEIELLQQTLLAKGKNLQTRARLEDLYRKLAQLDPENRAEYVSKANKIRPWSLL